MRIRDAAALGAVLCVLGAGSTAGAGVALLWDDAVDGDLSNDRLNPTAFVLGFGTSAIVSETMLSATAGGDRDYFSVTVGAGQVLTSIVLAESSSDGFDTAGFVGMQFGPQVTVDPDMPDASLLSGFAITSPDLVGTDILNMLSGQTSLGEGTYSFWVQQTGEFLTRIRLDFTVVPAPSGALALGMGLCLAGRRRR